MIGFLFFQVLGFVFTSMLFSDDGGADLGMYLLVAWYALIGWLMLRGAMILLGIVSEVDSRQRQIAQDTRYLADAVRRAERSGSATTTTGGGPSA